MKGWRQPIPTDLGFGGDEAAETVFILLLHSAANSDQTVSIDDQYIKLKRGQAIFGRYVYAKKLGLKRNEAGRCTRILNRLHKQHNRIDIRPTNKCTVVSIYNYDELVNMNNNLNNTQTTDKQQIDTHKNVKNVKKLATPKTNTNQQLTQYANLILEYREAGGSTISNKEGYLKKLERELVVEFEEISHALEMKRKAEQQQKSPNNPRGWNKGAFAIRKWDGVLGKYEDYQAEAAQHVLENGQLRR